MKKAELVVRSNDVQDDDAPIWVVFLLRGFLTTRSWVSFERQFQAWAALLTLPALPLFTLSNLLDDERR